MTPLLETHALEVEVNGRVLVRELALALDRGSLVALLGPNGVGKTLLLHTLAGLRTASAGTVLIRGADLQHLAQRERALALGLLLQEQDDPFPTTALDTVLMGRHARLGLWQWESTNDRAIARRALARMDLDTMERRMSATLSGGERRRLALATLLVQDPDVLLLDEPLNHLDPRHQVAVLAALRALADSGKGVIASLHDPVAAHRHFDHALLLHGDGRWQFGTAGSLLDAAALSALYGVHFECYRNEHAGGSCVMLPALASRNNDTFSKVTPLRPRRAR